MMLEERGTHFDADLLDLFFGSYDDVVEIRRSAGSMDAGRTIALAHVPRGS
ncbi:MAG: hypothetical protein H0V68_04010 [Actinobacteria bacterium]|nr:hypothetical protein [Actinomycetota bacterium]